MMVGWDGVRVGWWWGGSLEWLGLQPLAQISAYTVAYLVTYLITYLITYAWSLNLLTHRRALHPASRRQPRLAPRCHPPARSLTTAP